MRSGLAASRMQRQSAPCGGWPGADSRLSPGSSWPTSAWPSAVSVKPRARRGLIFGLIRLRSPAFISVQINVAGQVADVNGLRRTVIPTPENRKVGGSTPPLATRRYLCRGQRVCGDLSASVPATWPFDHARLLRGRARALAPETRRTDHVQYLLASAQSCSRARCAQA